MDGECNGQINAALDLVPPPEEVTYTHWYQTKGKWRSQSYSINLIKLTQTNGDNGTQRAVKGTRQGELFDWHSHLASQTAPDRPPGAGTGADDSAADNVHLAATPQDANAAALPSGSQPSPEGSQSGAIQGSFVAQPETVPEKHIPRTDDDDDWTDAMSVGTNAGAMQVDAMQQPPEEQLRESAQTTEWQRGGGSWKWMAPWSQSWDAWKKQ